MKSPRLLQALSLILALLLTPRDVGSQTITVDGSFDEPHYTLLAEKTTTVGTWPESDVTAVYYAVEPGTIFIAVESQIQSTPATVGDEDWPNGLGIWLDFTGESGAPAGTGLGKPSFSRGAHYLNGFANSELDFRADFEVDYMFAVYSKGTPDSIFIDAATHVTSEPKPSGFQVIAETDQSGTAVSGPSSFGVLSPNAVTVAYQASELRGDKRGFELAIQGSEVSGGTNHFRLFAFIVSTGAFFSNATVPGEVTIAPQPGSDFAHLGFQPDFSANRTSPFCGCADPDVSIGAGPFHTDFVDFGTATDIEPISGPSSFALSQNYPNPFNPTTTISYTLPQATDVTLTVYDVLGRTVRQLASGTKLAGTHEVTFDATGLPSGVYFYRLQARDYVESRRMVIVK